MKLVRYLKVGQGRFLGLRIVLVQDSFARGFSGFPVEQSSDWPAMHARCHNDTIADEDHGISSTVNSSLT
jgi:hypothetical protein